MHVNHRNLEGHDNPQAIRTHMYRQATYCARFGKTSAMKLSILAWGLCVFMVAAMIQSGDGQAQDLQPGQQLIAAAEHDDVATVQQLLKNGADVRARDAQGRTALLAATAHNQIDIAALLIDAGADVNAQDERLDSPLLLAGAGGHLEILQRILAANPDFTTYNRFGGTALIPACERGHVEVVRALLQTNIDVDHVNMLGWTALLETIILSDGGPAYQDIVRLLIAAGANVNRPDGKGITPLQHAQQQGHKEIARMLESAGGK